MKIIKKTLAILLGVSILLTGCASSETSPQVEKKKEPVTETKTATLYTSMETGSETANFETHSFEYTGDLTVEKLAQGLSDLTGLDFYIIQTPSEQSKDIIIDWQQNSTLIENLGDREQKEEFFFYDADSMRWFMMDSLWRTVMENFDVENVYYTMDGGYDLVLDELYPINEFPNDTPYMGSAFYSAHSDINDDYTISEDDAYSLVQYTMEERGEFTTVIMQNGDETIDGEHVYTFSAGDYSDDGQKFTAMFHYAVSDSGNVYYMDDLDGADWILVDLG